MKKTKLSCFDFDGTLVSTPIASPKNKEKWEKHYGIKWKYLGWWGRDESLDTDVWDMPAVEEVFNDYQTEIHNPNTLTILLTGRLQKQENIVRRIVNDLGYTFDYYLFNTGGNTLSNKINHLNNLLNKYPDIRDVELWDDRVEHFKDFEDWGLKLKQIGRIDYFYLNKIKSNQWDDFVE
jgi:hypothetical protein